MENIDTLDFAYGLEWTILELLCKGLTSSAEQEVFFDLVNSDHLNWGELIEQAVRHRMLPNVAYHVTSRRLRNTTLLDVEKHLRTALDLNRHRLCMLRSQAGRIVQALNERHIQFVGTKGITFESTIYSANGSRYMNDLDFMIAPADRDGVISAMSQLGYRMEAFEWSSGKIVPYERKDTIVYKLNPDHIPVFTLLTGDAVVPCIQVDFANSLTWSRSPYEIPIATAFLETWSQPIPNISNIELPCFNPHFQFIFTTLHLFREAWFDKWLKYGKDVNLTKFGDVIRVWDTYHDYFIDGQFVSLIREYQLLEPILWVLEHLDRTFGLGMVNALGLEGQVTEDWLASSHNPGGGVRVWKGTMRQRLHSKDRYALFG
jgi:hypothetical protein